MNKLIYRLIVRLERLLGGCFLLLATAIFVFNNRVFSNDGFVLSSLAGLLFLLFAIGAYMAPDDPFPAISGRQAFHMDLFILAAASGGLGLLSLASDSSLCSNGTGRFCGFLMSIALPLGFSNLDVAISVVLISLGVFFAVFGYRTLHANAPR